MGKLKGIFTKNSKGLSIKVKGFLLVADSPERIGRRNPFNVPFSRTSRILSWIINIMSI